MGALFDSEFNDFLLSMRFVYTDNPDGFIRRVLDRLETDELGAVRRVLRAIQGNAFSITFLTTAYAINSRIS